MFEATPTFESRLKKVACRARAEIGWDKLSFEFGEGEPLTVLVTSSYERGDLEVLREGLGHSRVHSALFKRFPELKDPKSWKVDDYSRLEDLILIERKNHALLTLLGLIVDEFGDDDASKIKVDASFHHYDANGEEKNICFDVSLLPEVQAKAYDSYLIIVNELFRKLYDTSPIYEQYMLEDKSRFRNNPSIFWSDVYSLPGRFVGENKGRSQGIYWSYLSRESWAKAQKSKLGNLSVAEKQEILPLPFFSYTKEDVEKFAPKGRAGRTFVEGFAANEEERVDDKVLTKPSRKIAARSEIEDSDRVALAVGLLIDDFENNAENCLSLITNLREQKRDAKREEKPFPEIDESNFVDRMIQYGTLLYIQKAEIPGKDFKRKQCQDSAKAWVDSFTKELKKYLLCSEDTAIKVALANWLASELSPDTSFNILDPVELLIDASISGEIYQGFDVFNKHYPSLEKLDFALMVARAHSAVIAGIWETPETSRVQFPLRITNKQIYDLLFEFSLLNLAETLAERGLIPPLSDEQLHLREKSKRARREIDVLPDQEGGRKLFNQSLALIRSSVMKLASPVQSGDSRNEANV